MSIDWTKPLEDAKGRPCFYVGPRSGGGHSVSYVEGSTHGNWFDKDGYRDGKNFSSDAPTGQLRNRAESQWGAEIEVNGVRPDWLRTTDKVDLRTSGGWIYSHNGASDVPPEDWAWTHYNGAPCIRAIRLPADHPYYLATSRGFTYWPGGNAAPGDWAQAEGEKTVLLANGEERYAVGWWDRKEGNNCSVIGYRKRPLPVAEQPEGDTVTIARMTPEQWGEQWPGYDFRTLAGLGLVREETRAERFTRMTGHVANDAVIAALEWERGE